MTTKRESIKNSNGFTLVELMITLFLTAIAMVGIYKGYTSFSQAADAQEQIVEMQQNLRIGMYHLEKDIRRAGMKEEDGETIGFLEDECFTNMIGVAADLTGGETDGVDNDNDDAIDGDDTDDFPFDESTYGDGDTEDPGEQIVYYLMYEDEGTGDLQMCPTAFDPDIYPCYLMREDSKANGGAGVRHKIIGNVDALNFVYLPEERLPPITVPVTGVAPGDLDDIRVVQVCLVVRTTNEDYRYTNNDPYENIDPSGADIILPPQGDNFRRRVFCKEIKIRNTGI